MRGIITLAALALSATVANASWTGCKIGAVAGMTAGVTSASATSPFLVGASIALDGLGTDGAEVGGLVGCDLQVGDRFVVGAFADYVFRDQEWSISATDGVDSLKLSTPFGDQWSIGGRAGILATPTTLIYGLVAYTEAKGGDISLAVNGTTLGGVPLGDLKGYSVGGGFESQIWQNVVASLEYRYTMFDTRKLDVGFAAVDLDTDTHSVRAGLAFKFGPETTTLLPTR